MPMECHASKFSNYIGLGLMYSFLYQISEISKSPFHQCYKSVCVYFFHCCTCPRCCCHMSEMYILKKKNENYKTLCTHDYSNVGYVTSRGGGGVSFFIRNWILKECSLLRAWIHYHESCDDWTKARNNMMDRSGDGIGPVSLPVITLYKSTL